MTGTIATVGGKDIKIIGNQHKDNVQIYRYLAHAKIVLKEMQTDTNSERK